MALGTYSELKAEVADWLHRADLTAKIPTFITLAEVTINTELNTRTTEKEAPLVTVPTSRYVALPADFGTPIGLWLEQWQPRQPLTAMLPGTIPVDNAVSGIPVAWCIDGANIAFQRPADQAYALAFRYFRNFALSDTSPTNDILTRFPNVYLYGTLLEAMPYLQNDARIPVWQGKFMQAMAMIKADENKNKSIAPLMTELAGLTGRGRRFNINSGQ